MICMCSLAGTPACSRCARWQTDPGYQFYDDRWNKVVQPPKEEPFKFTLPDLPKKTPAKLSEEIGAFFKSLKEQGIEEPLLSQLVSDFAREKMRQGV